MEKVKKGLKFWCSGDLKANTCIRCSICVHLHDQYVPVGAGFGYTDLNLLHLSILNDLMST